MSRRTLFLLIGVLLILSCCFSMALGLSFRPPSFLSQEAISDLVLTRPAADTIRNRLTTQVRPGDMTVIDGARSGCKIQGSNLVVPEDVTCRFGIPVEDDQTRQLNLAVNAPTQSVASLLEQEEALSVDKQLIRGQRPYPYDIYSSQNATVARLTLDQCALEKEKVGEGTPVPKGNCIVKIGG